MKSSLSLSLLCLYLAIQCFGVSAFGAPAHTDTVAFGRFGTVHLYYNDLAPQSVALFVSGDGGWNLGVIDMAKMLADENVLVVGIDIRHYLKELAETDAKCVYPAADFEALSQFIQRELHLGDYTTPVLIGYSSGATLVYAVLVQAPGNTFSGALSLGFCPDLEFPKPFCKGEGLAWTDLKNGKGFNFLPAPELAHPWVVLEGVIDQVCDPPSTATFVSQVPRGRLISLEHVGHGFSVPKNWEPQFRDAYHSLARPASHAEGRTASEQTVPDQGDAEHLPLVELPASDPSNNTLAILLSGDGGWSSFDQGVAEELVSGGVAVVGLNSLKYFWKKRTPEETANLVSALAQHYFAEWNKSRLLLIGYSFGADIVPHIITRLPASLRTQLPLAVMIGPSHHADFEFHVTSWLNKVNSESLPVIPELQKIHDVKILALDSAEEKESLCKDVPPNLLKCVLLKGGHHFDKDYDTIARVILGELNP